MVGNGERLLLIVRHIGDSQVEALLQLANVLAHAPPQLGVEIGQRLVEQEHLRLQYERACHRDALLLASGEFGGRTSLEP